MNDTVKVTFLGTGTSQGVPVIACRCSVCVSLDFKNKRLRSSILVETGGKQIVIDTGPDFRQQMLREKISRIDAVVYTHDHIDHISGLDDIRAFNFVLKKRMDIFCSHYVNDSIRRQFPYIFSEFKYPGIPEIDIHIIENKAFSIEDISILPVEVQHLKLPVFGYRIGGFTYITDANYISETEKEKIKGCDVIVLNALRREPHPSHFTLQEAIDLMIELKPKRAYFTHISHQLGLHNNVERELPSFIKLAYDGLRIEV